MRRIIIGSFTAVVLLILFVVLCTFVRRPYEKVLLDRFGNLIQVPDKGTIAYNWYFKLPTDVVIPIDTRLHLKVMPLKEFVTKGHEPINVKAFVVWRIVDPVKFRQRASGSDEIAADIMQQRILGLMGQDLGGHQLDEFFNSTDPNTDEHIRQIESQIASEATVPSGTTPGLKDLGIEIADIGFSRMAFPPDNTTAVYQRMVADLNEKARAYEASGLADAKVAIAQGQVKAQEIRSKAQAEAEQIRGKGDEEAGEIIASVSNTPQAMEFYQYWKSLDVLKASLTKSTILVLSSDNPVLKDLFDVLRNGAKPLPFVPGISAPLVPPAATAPAAAPLPEAGK